MNSRATSAIRKPWISHALHPGGLYTDFYELTMAQGYFLSGQQEAPAIFDYFFRINPYDGGFVIFAGLADFVSALESFTFPEEALQYLSRQGFRSQFLEWLSDFRFRGTIHACREGEPVFPLEPVVRVEGTIIETQLIETILLNILNFESLIATKAARLRLAGGDIKLADFGLRRAQGLGGVFASRAAFIGGVDATSNVFSAYHYNLPALGTQAHSWIQCFDSELEAFRTYAEYYPDSCVLLVDTYDTLKSGVPNAITVGKELEAKGYKLKGIRLDSGDLAFLSKEARKMLDAAGLDYVSIVASNQLDEYLVRSLEEQEAQLDSLGVGTSLVIGQGAAALDGVYKLAQFKNRPSLKVSENFTKVTLPGRKQVFRCIDQNDQFYADAILLVDEAGNPRKIPSGIHHPHFPEQSCRIDQCKLEPLMSKVVVNGEVREPLPDETAAAAYGQSRLRQLPDEHKRFENPHIYKVGISPEILDLRQQLISEIRKTNHINLNSKGV